MGQTCSCCGAFIRKGMRRRTRQKRFDFAPKRSWKYKDATLLNEFHEMEMSHDVGSNHQDTEQLIDDNGAAASSNNVNYDGASSDEEEIDTGNYRPSGRLVFEEADSDDEMEATPTSRGGYAHLDLDQTEDDNRDRSQSTGSEQIGRFEVWTVDENESKDQNSSKSEPRSTNEDETRQLMSTAQT